MGPSWCFDSGRMGFALSSIVTLVDHNTFFEKEVLNAYVFFHEAVGPCSDAWHAWPIFRSTPNELPARNISCKHGASWACPSRYDSSTLCMSSRLQRNQIEQNRSQKR
eukprot:UN25175